MKQGVNYPFPPNQLQATQISAFSRVDVAAPHARALPESRCLNSLREAFAAQRPKRHLVFVTVPRDVPQKNGPDPIFDSRTDVFLSTLAQILHRVLPSLIHHALDLVIDFGFEFLVIRIAHPPEVRKLSHYATAPP